jgi:hypothetical protein
LGIIKTGNELIDRLGELIISKKVDDKVQGKMILDSLLLSKKIDQ